MGVPRLLIAEDHEQTLEFYSRVARSDGLEVVGRTDGADALATWSTQHFDVVVLDLRLPVLSGVEVCRRMRSRGDQTPVMALTGLASEAAELEALGAGADDYVIKPCSFDRFRARIRALLRRSSYGPRRIWRLGPWVIDEASGTALIPAELDGEGPSRAVTLSGLELRVLALLIARPGEVVSRDQLLSTCWIGEKHVSDNALAAVAVRLRRKLDCPGVTIRAVRGRGLTLDVRRVTKNAPPLAANPHALLGYPMGAGARSGGATWE